MERGGQGVRIDVATIVGIGLSLLPLTTMWHEIGGHAAICALQGGQITAIGAFYVDCEGLTGAPRVLVACAGVIVDTIAAILLHALWRRARGDTLRLALWFGWVTKAFVAAGYFCFSGASGMGDLGPGVGGGIGPLPMPLLWRAGELAFGIVGYVLLVRHAIRTLTIMLGNSAITKAARRRIAHVYYATLGIGALLVGLMNPVGWFITVMSAAASSLGGNAGFISIGFAVPHGEGLRAFSVPRNWAIIIAGFAVITMFAVILGPSIQFAGP